MAAAAPRLAGRELLSGLAEGKVTAADLTAVEAGVLAALHELQARITTSNDAAAPQPRGPSPSDGGTAP